MGAHIIRSPTCATTQNFNYQPWEGIAYTKDCRAGATSVNPTCGWYYWTNTTSGVKTQVPDSQGFCCDCSVGEGFSESFAGKDTKNRGNIDCSLLGNGLFIGGRPASAHCLRFSEQWYSGYSIGEMETRFIIRVIVEPPPGQSGGSGSDFLIVAPSKRVAVSRNKEVRIRLHGDLAGYRAPRVLSEKILLWPRCDSPSIANGSCNPRELLLVDREMVTFDGRECNRIGVGHYAFRNEVGKCSKQIGSCLNNQIKYYREQDHARMAAGQRPLYIIDEDWTYWINPQLTGIELGFPIADLQESVVSIEMSADRVRWTVTVSPGSILNVTVPTFAAMSPDGYLLTAVTNTGRLSAEYEVAAANCSGGMQGSIAPQRVRMEPAEVLILRFELHSTVEGALDNHTCIVTLWDAQGDELDRVVHTFSTSDVRWSEGGQGGEEDRSKTLDELKDEHNRNCLIYCPNVFDVVCAFKKRCWRRIGEAVGIVASVIAAFVILRVMQTTGVFRALGSLLRFLFRGDDKHKRSKGWESPRRQSRSGRVRRRRGHKHSKQHRSHRGSSSEDIGGSSYSEGGTDSDSEGGSDEERGSSRKRRARDEGSSRKAKRAQGGGKLGSSREGKEGKEQGGGEGGTPGKRRGHRYGRGGASGREKGGKARAYSVSGGVSEGGDSDLDPGALSAPESSVRGSAVDADDRFSDAGLSESQGKGMHRSTHAHKKGVHGGSSRQPSDAYVVKVAVGVPAPSVASGLQGGTSVASGRLHAHSPGVSPGSDRHKDPSRDRKWLVNGGLRNDPTIDAVITDNPLYTADKGYV
eukprot:jgi/Mesvir1/14492/Mv05193-RA.1